MLDGPCPAEKGDPATGVREPPLPIEYAEIVEEFVLAA
jgi:hypothetical protein